MSDYRMAQPTDSPVYCGIDPDLKKSGVAIVKDGQLRELISIPFHQLMMWIECHPEYIYALENVNINKSLYAKHSKKPESVKLRIAQNVGQCKAVATLIQEKFDQLELVYELVTPLKGRLKECKTNTKLFKQLTGWQRQSNPDNRDAAMLLFRYMKK